VAFEFELRRLEDRCDRLEPLYSHDEAVSSKDVTASLRLLTAMFRAV